MAKSGTVPVCGKLQGEEQLPQNIHMCIVVHSHLVTSLAMFFPLFLRTSGANTPLISAASSQKGEEKRTFRQSVGTQIGFIIVLLI